MSVSLYNLQPVQQKKGHKNIKDWPIRATGQRGSENLQHTLCMLMHVSLIRALSVVSLGLEDFHKIWEIPLSALHLLTNRLCINFDSVCKSWFVWQRAGWERDRERKGEVRYRLHLQPTGVGIPMQKRQRGGKRAEVGGGVKRRRVRWGRAHSVGS